LSRRYCYLPLSWKSWNWFECAVGGVRHPQRQIAVTVWQIPDAVDAVVCAHDDGWKYHPKHVEQFPDINKLCNVASRWIYTGILLGAHPILRISRIKVNVWHHVLHLHKIIACAEVPCETQITIVYRFYLFIYLFIYTKTTIHTLKCVITTAVENVPHVLKTNIHPLWHFLQFFEMFLGKCRQKFVSCYVTVVQNSWIIVVDSLFKKSPQTKSQVAWDLGVVVAKAHAWQFDHRISDSRCYFRSMDRCTFWLQPATLLFSPSRTTNWVGRAW
jgi:hypothetical protein